MTTLKVARAMLDFQCQTVFHVILCWSLFSSKQCVIKQLLDSVFVISEIIKARGKCYQPRPSGLAGNAYPDLISADITKTSSNNCLLNILIVNYKNSDIKHVQIQFVFFRYNVIANSGYF